jgi:hypothetical protein
MSPKISRRSPDPEEETPLLHDTNLNPRRKETPLPITQIVFLSLQLTEPIMSSSIKPYINKVHSLNLITKVLSDVRSARQ